MSPPYNPKNKFVNTLLDRPTRCWSELILLPRLSASIEYGTVSHEVSYTVTAVLYLIDVLTDGPPSEIKLVLHICSETLLENIYFYKVKKQF